MGTAHGKVFFVRRPKALPRWRLLEWSCILEDTGRRFGRSVIIAHKGRSRLVLGTQMGITLASLLVIDA